MDSILYVYDTTSLSNLRNKLNDYKFYSIAYFFNIGDTLDNLNELDFERFQISI